MIIFILLVIWQVKTIDVSLYVSRLLLIVCLHLYKSHICSNNLISIHLFSETIKNDELLNSMGEKFGISEYWQNMISTKNTLLSENLLIFLLKLANLKHIFRLSAYPELFLSNDYDKSKISHKNTSIKFVSNLLLRATVKELSVGFYEKLKMNKCTKL